MGFGVVTDMGETCTASRAEYQDIGAAALDFSRPAVRDLGRAIA